MFSFRRSGPTAPWVDPYASDLAYCTRLLNAYRELRATGMLLAEPPAWTTEQFGKDLVLLDTPQMLQSAPRVQAALAGITSYTPSKWLLEQELSVRESHSPQPLTWDNPAEQSALTAALARIGEKSLADRLLPAPNSSAQRLASWSSASEDVYAAAAREVLAGLCFSGGGIRSATFNLGILQAFASSGKLGRFDYLSTVSGGGYIHEWLSSWIRNEPGRFDAVQSRLRPLPGPGSAARAPEQITWLRRYSSYSVDLDQFHGLDQIGEEGLKDKVNNHYLEIFGTSIALGVIAGAGEIEQGGGTISTSGSQAFTTGSASSVSQSATSVLDRFMQIPPTITIREGHRVKVYFTQDMLLPAYENHTIPQTF
jgi:hypothetical protein